MRYFAENLKNQAADRAAEFDQVLKSIMLGILATAAIIIVSDLIFSGLMRVWPWTKYIAWFVYDAGIIAGIYYTVRTAHILSIFTAGGLVNGMPDIQIGKILTAPFTKEKWPDFELKKFLAAGGEYGGLALVWFSYVPVGLGLFTVATTIFITWNPWAVFSVIGGLLMLAFVEIIRKGKAVFFIRFAYLIALMQVGIGGYDMFHRSTYVEAVKKQGTENAWQADESAVQPVYETLKKGLQPNGQAMATVENVESARDAQGLIARAGAMWNGGVVKQITIRDLRAGMIYGIPDGEWKVTFADEDPILFTMLPDSGSPTGMKATKNSLTDPTFTIVFGDSNTTFGGKVTVRNGRISYRLRVPPDAEANIRAGKFTIAESTVNIKFE
ncbi:MAG: hypothetical protein HGB37_02710 [Candidatus Moranbacteria bacterium]|nr:hypothetical protein [Candidatus Moranbacteria bacterium]